MKKCLCVILLILSLSPVCFAHSGKTDSNGGHYDSSTGEYHYHHGYPAHQHTNGKCPYDFDDRTGENSGSPSSDNSSSFSGNNSLYPSTGNSGTSPSKDSSSWSPFWRIIVLIVIAPPILFLCFLFFVVPVLVPILKAIGKRNAKERECKYVLSTYYGKTRNQIAKLCGMPDGLYVDDNSLPHDIGKPPSLDRCTVYLQYHRSIYHAKSSCTRGKIQAINITETRFYTPCPKCCPEHIDLTWHQKYTETLRLIQRYGIEPVSDVLPDQPPACNTPPVDL